MKNNNSQNLEILRDFRFPKDFVEKQKQLFSKFYNELSANSFFGNLNNGNDEFAIQILIETFSKTYNLKNSPEIEYYDNESFIKEYESKYKAKCQSVPTMCAENNTLKIHRDVSKNLGNKEFVESIFHECIHLYQNQGDFSQYPEVEKGFKELGQLAIDKSLYYYQPTERHAYSMQQIFSHKLSQENKFINKTEKQKNKTENVYETQDKLWKYIYGHSFSQGLGVDEKKVKKWQEESIPSAISEYQQLASSKETNVDVAYDKIFLNSKIVNYDNKTRCIHFTTESPQNLYDMFGSDNVVDLGNNKYQTTPISNRQEHHLRNGYARHLSRQPNQRKI